LTLGVQSKADHDHHDPGVEVDNTHQLKALYISCRCQSACSASLERSQKRRALDQHSLFSEPAAACSDALKHVETIDSFITCLLRIVLHVLSGKRLGCKEIWLVTYNTLMNTRYLPPNRHHSIDEHAVCGHVLHVCLHPAVSSQQFIGDTQHMTTMHNTHKKCISCLGHVGVRTWVFLIHF